MQSPDIQDRDLVERALAGDDPAFAVLYQRYAPMLVRTATLITGDRGLAEDAVQETFVRAYQHLRDLCQTESAAPWLRRVVVHAAIDRLRRRRWWLRPFAAVSERSLSRLPAQTRETPEARTDLAAALSQLSPGPRAAVVLRYYHDLPEAAVAHELRVPAGTVKSWLHRGVARLRQCAELSGYDASAAAPPFGKRHAVHHRTQEADHGTDVAA